MENLFNKKDINKINESSGKIEKKDFQFGIIKLLLIIFSALMIILIIFVTVSYCAFLLPDQKMRQEYKREEIIRQEQYQNCLTECDSDYPDPGPILPDDPDKQFLSEKEVLRDDCLSLCKKRYPQFPPMPTCGYMGLYAIVHIVIAIIKIILFGLAVISSALFFIKKGRFKIIPIIFWVLVFLWLISSSIL